MSSRWDFAVVGSGAGGSAAAATLAEGGARVLLVEQGFPARPWPDAVDAIYKHYHLGGLQSATGNCLLPIPTGRALGGTTKINSSTCLRTPPALLRKWEAESRGAFDAGEFEGWLDKAWARLNVKTAPVETMSASTRLFFRGLDKLGIAGAHRLDRAETGCSGAGRCCFVCPEGAKMSADKAFLEPLRERKGFTLACGEALTAVEPSSTEVRLRLRDADGRERRVSCAALILSCGALRTPYFVRRFRLGARHAAAGDGLSVHPAAKIFGLFDETLSSWKGVPQGGGLVDPLEPQIRYEGVYTPPELAAVTMPLEGRRLRSWMDRFARVATFGFMVRDRSRGTVRYPLGPEFPAIRYDMGREDASLMLRGMRFVAKTFLAAGARSVLLPLNRDDNEFSSIEELEKADWPEFEPRQLSMMAFHPLGTCGVGRVVDATLKAAERVYVCDGSVVPESLGVNPQITIYAFALRLGARLLHGG